MAGVKGLRRIQIGKEGTAGTAVAATAKLRFNGMIADDRETVWPEEQVGYLGGVDRWYTSRLGATLEMEGEATFEQLPYVLNASLVGVTGVQDGAGTDWVYTYPFITTSQPTLYTYTIETGDDAGAEEMEYSYVQEFTLSGASGEAWMLSANWQGRQASVSTFSTSCTLPAVEEMIFGKTKVYIDAATATIGTTLKSDTLLAAEFKMVTGWTGFWTANGQNYYQAIKNIGDEITLDITFEHDATSIAEKAAWRAGTSRGIRLLIEGTSAATAGTTYTYKTVKIDMYGRWETFEKIDEIDGNDVCKGLFRVRYNLDASAKGSIVVVNEVAGDLP